MAWASGLKLSGTVGEREGDDGKKRFFSLCVEV